MQCVYGAMRTCFHVNMETPEQFAVTNNPPGSILIKDSSLVMMAPLGEPF